MNAAHKMQAAAERSPRLFLPVPHPPSPRLPLGLLPERVVHDASPTGPDYAPVPRFALTMEGSTPRRHPSAVRTIETTETNVSLVSRTFHVGTDTYPVTNNKKHAICFI